MATNVSSYLNVPIISGVILLMALKSFRAFQMPSELRIQFGARELLPALGCKKSGTIIMEPKEAIGSRINKDFRNYKNSKNTILKNSSSRTKLFGKWTMSWYANSSQQETYQTVKDYLAGRRYKILVSNSPSYVRAAFGSYVVLSLSPVTAKGEIEASIMKRNGGSYVNLNFDFTKGYLAGFISAILGAVVCYAGAYWAGGFSLSSVPPWAIEHAWRLFNTIMIGVMLLVFVVLMSLEGYYVSKTRRRFIREFDLFAHSLPVRNQGVKPIKKS